MCIAGLRFIQSTYVAIQQDPVKKGLIFIYLPKIMDNLFWKLHQSQEGNLTGRSEISTMTHISFNRMGITTVGVCNRGTYDLCHFQKCCRCCLNECSSLEIFVSLFDWLISLSVQFV
jgi:hypothetical protein